MKTVGLMSTNNDRFSTCTRYDSSVTSGIEAFGYSTRYSLVFWSSFKNSLQISADKINLTFGVLQVHTAVTTFFTMLHTIGKDESGTERGGSYKAGNKEMHSNSRDTAAATSGHGESNRDQPCTTTKKRNAAGPPSSGKLERKKPARVISQTGKFHKSSIRVVSLSLADYPNLFTDI